MTQERRLLVHSFNNAEGFNSERCLCALVSFILETHKSLNAHLLERLGAARAPHTGLVDFKEQG